MRNNPSILESYKKGLKVIDSCENYRQLQVAKKFMKRFLTVYKSEYSNDFNPVYSLYAEMLIKYENKYDLLYD